MNGIKSPAEAMREADRLIEQRMQQTLSEQPELRARYDALRAAR